ncbi:dihydrodipicolinate synthase family protein [Glutamicibacter sp.]|uniref:dihydrodipicolinate synthase family protein n=1 Tax=Glutamicibacter sp. TaxID=1931995 RepID=UPI0028BE3B04|nr:dihydrodipicolinate synthase family protein [Glutamicibacter sp.]
MSVFTGLSAFPLTPLHRDRVDEASFAALIRRLHSAGVDSITALGSTGSYAYLDGAERDHVAQLAVEHAAGTPVFIGVGDLRTSRVLARIDGAQAAGASGVLLAPLSYQRMNDEEVFGLFAAASAHSELPIIIYDNPGTTHFNFSPQLYARIAQLQNIASIKIPGVPADPAAAREHVQSLRDALPRRVSLGVSQDALAAAGLLAGCDGWYSVIGGILPHLALHLTRLAQSGQQAAALAESERLAPLWELFARFGGSIRVVAAIAELLGLAPADCLPYPIQGLDGAQRAEVARVLQLLELEG